MSSIHPHGYWLDSNDDHRSGFDPGLSAALHAMLEGKTVVDLGCGTNEYGFDLGVDGNPESPDGVLIADLTRPLRLPVFDWVVCLEVGEHIPLELAPALFNNIHRLGREGAVVSWAVPGQQGRGHINCQPNSWVEERMSGYRVDREAAAALRAAAGWFWFKDTIQVFVKAQFIARLPSGGVTIDPR